MPPIVPGEGTCAHGAHEEMAELKRQLQIMEERLAAAERPRYGSSVRWLGVPLLLLGAWTLSAQSSPSADVERRVADLEARLIKGPGGATQIRGPFHVLDRSGRTLLLVTDGAATGGEVVIRHREGAGASLTFWRSGQAIAGVGSASGGYGAVFVSDASGTPRAQLLGLGAVMIRDAQAEQAAGIVATDDGRGRVGVWRGDHRVVTLEEDAETRGAGALTFQNGQTATAYLGVDGQRGGGALRLWNGAGVVTTALLGDEGGGGAVLVGTPAGRTVAQMSASEAVGMFQVFNQENQSVAVLSQHGPSAGGVLQIKAALGTPVASITTGGTGGGYFQLNDAAGTTTVEAGTLPSGVGMVRVGPIYKCVPVQAATPVLSVGLPDCIMGGRQ